MCQRCLFSEVTVSEAVVSSQQPRDRSHQCKNCHPIADELIQKTLQEDFGKRKQGKRTKSCILSKKKCLDVETSIYKKNFCCTLSQLLNPCEREIFACFNDATNLF